MIKMLKKIKSPAIKKHQGSSLIIFGDGKNLLLHFPVQNEYHEAIVRIVGL